MNFYAPNPGPEQRVKPWSADPPGGVARSLAVDNNSVAPNTIIDISASAIVLEDASFNTYIARSVAVSCDSSKSGAGGMQVGTTIGNSTWYARHVIGNPWTGQIAALLSTSATTIIKPPGFTFSAFTGWHLTNSSALFHRIRQRARFAQYVVSAAVTTALPIAISGSSGTPSTGTYTAVAMTAYVPTTAATIKGTLRLTHSQGSLSSTVAILAPNANYGAAASTLGTNDPPVSVFAFVNNGQSGASIPFEFVNEGSLYYASTAAESQVQILGWSEAG